MKSWTMNHEHPEYKHMWNALSQMPVNASLPDPFVAWNEDYAQGWQYMGTWSRGGVVTHEFRHRAHPTTNERIVTRIPASSAYDGTTLVYEEVF